MYYVPGGDFTMGRDRGDGGDEYESPAHRVTLQPFFIDLYEVTCEDYEKFIKQTGHAAPAGWTGGSYPPDAARKPVTGVTWDDANAYAKWADKRLPTEEEWEFAARGENGLRYPWGNAWQTGSANANQAGQGMREVGSFTGKSPYGLFDMVGNAWEWTASSMKAYPGGQLLKPQQDDEKVIRGGSWQSNSEQATTTFRAGWHARSAKTYSETGFRCARDTPLR